MLAISLGMGLLKGIMFMKTPAEYFKYVSSLSGPTFKREEQRYQD
jgi:hypothetical protein